MIQRIRKKAILFFIFNLSALIFSQPDSSIINIEEKLEDFLEETSEEETPADLYDIIEYLSLNPVNINTAGIKEFMEIPFVNILQADIIIKHRNKYGNFYSVNELFSIRELDDEFVNQILPFVTIESKNSNKDDDQNFFKNLVENFNISLRSRTLNDIQQREGFAGNKYLGTNPKIYNRFLLKNSDLQAGVTFEKDSGEKMWNDFSSFHINIKNYSFIRNFTAGDYQLEFGQGLVLWSPYGFSKGSDAVFPVRKKEKKIKPYTSTDENNFFRGAALSFDISDFSLSFFYSDKNSDANIDSISGLISSTPLDGYHRTSGEVLRRKTLNEIVKGGRIDYSSEYFNTGILFYNSEFSGSFLPTSLYDLNGSNFSFTSVYYDFLYKNINIFGEAAYNSGSVASIINFNFNISKNFSFITSIRSYPEDFTDIHGFSFGERGGVVQNEYGIYTGFKWKIFLGELNFYYDRYKFPFSSFNNPLPASGEDLLFNFASKTFNGIKTNFKIKYEKKDDIFSSDATRVIFKGNKLRAKAEFIYNVSKKLRLKSRFEFVNYEVNELNLSENGFLFYQDFRINPFENLLLFSRIIFFKTDSFNTAVYQYENDLKGVYSSTALYGEGLRWYIMVGYKIFEEINFSVKYSETYKPGEKTLGSGNNLIHGNLDNRLSLQLDFYFN